MSLIYQVDNRLLLHVFTCRARYIFSEIYRHRERSTKSPFFYGKLGVDGLVTHTRTKKRYRVSWISCIFRRVRLGGGRCEQHGGS